MAGQPELPRPNRRPTPLALHIHPQEPQPRRQWLTRQLATLLSTLRIAPAFFAGIDLADLRKAPSERTFSNALGTAVLVFACMSGFTFCIALGYMLQKPPGYLWPLGAAWTVILLCVERLVLQMPTRRRRYLPVMFLARIAVSVLIAVQVSEPLVLKLNQGEINNVLSRQVTTQTKAAIQSNRAFFAPKIAADQHEIKAIQGHEAALRTKRDHYTFLSQCEANTASCSTTHKVGCGTYCLNYKRLAANEQTKLNKIKPGDATRIKILNADIANLRAREKKALDRRTGGIDAQDGILAREQALSQLEQHHPAVTAEVWFLRALFLSLDLICLFAKGLRILALGETPLDALGAAGRRRDTLEAEKLDFQTGVERDRLKNQASADKHTNRERIWNSVDDDVLPFPSGGGATVNAWSLEDLVGRSTPHEATAVEMPGDLRRGGLTGLALIASTAIGLLLATAIHLPLVGTLPAMLALVAGVAVATWTRGFTLAATWGLRATLATLITGLVMPFVIVALNLV